MTAQEVFDTVVRALREQGEPSYSKSKYECRYRASSDDGRTLKCAVGHLIPDDKYDPYMEGMAVDHPSLQGALESLGLWEHADLLNELQQAHDVRAAKSPDEWLADFLTRARNVAAEFELDPKEAL